MASLRLVGEGRRSREERVAGVGQHAYGELHVRHHEVGFLEPGLDVLEIRAVVIVGRIGGIAAVPQRGRDLGPVRHDVADEHDADGVGLPGGRRQPEGQQHQQDQRFFSVF